MKPHRSQTQKLSKLSRIVTYLAPAIVLCLLVQGSPALSSSATLARDVRVSAAPGPRSTAAEQQLAVEREILVDVARNLAVALHDPSLRMRLKSDLRASRFTPEHKLPLQAYLRGRGAGVLAGMAHSVGKAPTDILTRMNDLRGAEIYVPVPGHRESWTGGEDLIVAWQLTEEEAPVGYRTDGSEVTLSNEAPPTTPTIVIVPAETDFSRPLPQEWRNSRDHGGAAIGTYSRVTLQESMSSLCSPEDPDCECDPEVNDYCEPPPTAPAPIVYPSGVYLDYSQIYDDGEAWVRGSAEIEAFVIGPTFYATSQGERISCAGQGAGGARHFDQNSSQWRAAWWLVEGQLLSRAEVDHYHQIYNAPYSIQFWEDDQDACEIVYSGRSQLEQLFDNLRAAARATTIIVSILTGGTYDPVSGRVTLDPGQGNALRAIIPGIFQSDDDFLGDVVYRPGSTTTTVNATYDTYTIGDLERPQGNNGYVRVRTVD